MVSHHHQTHPGCQRRSSFPVELFPVQPQSMKEKHLRKTEGRKAAGSVCPVGRDPLTEVSLALQRSHIPEPSRGDPQQACRCPGRGKCLEHWDFMSSEPSAGNIQPLPIPQRAAPQLWQHSEAPRGAVGKRNPVFNRVYVFFKLDFYPAGEGINHFLWCPEGSELLQPLGERWGGGACENLVSFQI